MSVRALPPAHVTSQSHSPLARIPRGVVHATQRCAQSTCCLHSMLTCYPARSLSPGKASQRHLLGSWDPWDRCLQQRTKRERKRKQARCSSDGLCDCMQHRVSRFVHARCAPRVCVCVRVCMRRLLLLVQAVQRAWVGDPGRIILVHTQLDKCLHMRSAHYQGCLSTHLHASIQGARRVTGVRLGHAGSRVQLHPESVRQQPHNHRRRCSQV